MKANDKQTKKSHSVAELEAELRTAEEKRFRLLFKHRSNPLDNPAELRTLRRDIARFKTWIGEKNAAAEAAQ